MMIMMMALCHDDSDFSSETHLEQRVQTGGVLHFVIMIIIIITIRAVTIGSVALRSVSDCCYFICSKPKT